MSDGPALLRYYCAQDEALRRAAHRAPWGHDPHLVRAEKGLAEEGLAASKAWLIECDKTPMSDGPALSRLPFFFGAGATSDESSSQHRACGRGRVVVGEAADVMDMWTCVCSLVLVEDDGNDEDGESNGRRFELGVVHQRKQWCGVRRTFLCEHKAFGRWRGRGSHDVLWSTCPHVRVLAVMIAYSLFVGLRTVYTTKAVREQRSLVACLARLGRA